MSEGEKLAYTQGIWMADAGYTFDEMQYRINILKGLDPPYDLIAMSLYDGYVRRKHGLIDSEGYEVFT